MIAAPYYLLAGGIALVIAGFFIAAVSQGSKPQKRISGKMRDAEIVQHLRNENRIRLHSVVFVAGVLCILVSLVWRMARLVQAH